MKIAPELLTNLTDYNAWRADKGNFDLLDYANCVATPDLFFGFLALLCPELVMHCGNYFLAHHFDAANYDAWMDRLGDPVQAQKVMNHLHISTLLQGQEVPDAIAQEVAGRIAECWSVMFAAKGLVGAAYGETLEDAEVTLFRRE